MKLARHKIDQTVCRDILAERKATLPQRYESARLNASNLATLAGDLLDVALYSTVADPDPESISAALRGALQASTALFASGQGNCSSVTYIIGDFECKFADPPHVSLIECRRWLTAYYVATILRDADALDVLCKVPLIQLRNSTTKHPEYRYWLVDGLSRYWTESRDSVKCLLESLRFTDPERPDILSKDWTLYIDIPLLKLFFYAITDDTRLNESLTEGVSLHKKYWSASERSRNDRNGFISLVGQRHLASC